VTLVGLDGISFDASTDNNCGLELSSREPRESNRLPVYVVLVSSMSMQVSFIECWSGHVAVDGGWTEWAQWSVCSRSCGDSGVKTRSRDCTQPPPQLGGLACTGVAVETITCNVRPCPGKASSNRRTG